MVGTIVSITLWPAAPGSVKDMLKNPAFADVSTHYQSEYGLMGRMARNDCLGTRPHAKPWVPGERLLPLS